MNFKDFDFRVAYAGGPLKRSGHTKTYTSIPPRAEAITKLCNGLFLEENIGYKIDKRNNNVTLDFCPSKEDRVHATYTLNRKKGLK